MASKSNSNSSASDSSRSAASDRASSGSADDRSTPGHAPKDRASSGSAASDRAASIVSRMYNGDAFSQWLGIEVVEVAPGRAVLQMTVRPEMTNGFKIAHGGISYSLADSALAFASNGYGRQALSIDTSIQHLKPVEIGQILVAEAVEDHVSNRLGHYRVRIVRADQPDEPIALFKGIVYRTEKTWEHE